MCLPWPAGQATMEAAQAVAEQVARLRQLLQEIDNAQQTWTSGLRDILRRGGTAGGAYWTCSRCSRTRSGWRWMGARRSRLPVTLPKASKTKPSCSRKRSTTWPRARAHGLAGLFGKSEQKRQLESVVVVGAKPASETDWGPCAPVHPVPAAQQIVAGALEHAGR